MSESKLNLTTTVEFDPALLAHKDKMAEHVTKDTATGTVTVAKEFFVNNMPENVTVDTYKAAMAYRDLNINAAALLSTELGVGMLKENKDLQRVNFLMPTMGHSKLEGGIKRENRYPDGNGGMTTALGGMAAFAYTDSSSRGAGELKSIKKYLTEIAAANLSD